MNRRIFTDDQNEKVFHRDGYVLFRGLLTAEDIDKIQSVCHQFVNEFSSSFHTTHFSRNSDYKLAAHQVISEVAGKKIAEHLNQYLPLFGNFMVKKPDPDTSLDIHSDWTYVDENFFTSVALWSPLVETTVENGCLGVVKGSQRITNSIRGPLIRESSRNFNAYWADRFGTLLPMKAGDAIVYHHGFLHFSLANKTKALRPAINLTLVPQEADIIHYCMPPDASSIEKYRVPDTSFYISYHHFERPNTRYFMEYISSEKVKFIDDKMKNYNWKRWFHLLKQFVTRNP